MRFKNDTSHLAPFMRGKAKNTVLKLAAEALGIPLYESNSAIRAVDQDIMAEDKAASQAYAQSNRNRPYKKICRTHTKVWSI